MSRLSGGVDAADLATDALLEFLEAAIHATLHRRGIYPPEMFELQRVYAGVHAQRARPPELLDYVSDFLSALRPMVRSGAAQLVAVVVTTATRVPLERHVFEFGLADAAATASALASAGSHPAPAGAADAEALQLLERLLGETLATLGAADAWLRPLPPDCTFQLMAHTTDRGADADVYWVTKDVLTEGGIGAIGPHTVPVHSLGERQQAPLLRVQVMVEQAQPQEQQAQLHDPWDMHGACASDDDAAGGADFMS